MKAGGRGIERHYAVAAEGTKITLECRNGHRYVKDYGKGPVSKRVPAWWITRMLRYWGKANGGVSAPRCRRCASTVSQ